MPIRPGGARRRGAVACLGAGLAALVLAACTSVLGFPDRVLDEGAVEAGLPEAGTSTDIDGSAPDAPVPPAEAGAPAAAISMAGLDFGMVPCGGAAPAAKTVGITNVGGAPLTWTASLSTTPDFALSGPSGGTIAPGENAIVTITTTAVPSSTGAGTTAQAVLTLRTNDPARAETDLPLKRTAAGGTLELVPLTAAFGGSPVGVPAADIPVTLKNVGNAPVTVSLAQPGDGQFSVT